MKLKFEMGGHYRNAIGQVLYSGIIPNPTEELLLYCLSIYQKHDGIFELREVYEDGKYDDVGEPMHLTLYAEQGRYMVLSYAYDKSYDDCFIIGTHNENPRENTPEYFYYQGEPYPASHTVYDLYIVEDIFKHLLATGEYSKDIL